MGKVWSKPGSDFQRVSQRMYQYLIPQATNCSNLYGMFFLSRNPAQQLRAQGFDWGLVM